jgi:hypothetical protein
VKGSAAFFSSVGVCGGVMLAWGLNKLGALPSTRGFLVSVGGCDRPDTEPRGGVPGRLKWTVLGRKSDAMKIVMMGSLRKRNLGGRTEKNFQ